jgi:uncharacterized RDD family membrane protein YckC
MQCPDCGAENVDDAAFCLTCRRSFARSTVARATLPASGEPGAATAYTYARYGDRLIAFILDSLFAFSLALVPAVVFGIVFGVIEYNTLPDDSGNGDTPLIVFFGLIVGGALGVLAYHLVMTARGGGWGKRIVGIKVIRARDGLPPGYGSAFARVGFVAVLWLVPIVGTPAQILDYLWPLWDKDNHALHDKVARTHVIKQSPPSKSSG